LKKRVLLFIYQLSAGGAEKKAVEIANNLSGRYDVTVRTIIDCSSERTQLHPSVKYEFCFDKQFRVDKWLFKLGYFLSPKLLHRLLIPGDYDVEIAGMEGVPSKVVSGCRKSKTQLIAIIHASCKNIAWPRGRYLNKKQEVDSYSGFDNLVFVSTDTRRDFFQVFPEVHRNAVVLHNPFDFAQIRESAQAGVCELEIQPNRFIFCAVGRLESVKGFDRLIQAMKSIVFAFPNTDLIIVGGGPLEEELKALVKDLGLSEHVFLVGPRHNPYPYISQANCYVCSSVSEGLSTTVIEALALARPVVATDCGGMEDALGGGRIGLVVENSENGLLEGLFSMREGLLNEVSVAELERHLRKFEKDSYFDRFQALIEGEDS